MAIDRDEPGGMPLEIKIGMTGIDSKVLLDGEPIRATGARILLSGRGVTRVEIDAFVAWDPDGEADESRQYIRTIRGTFIPDEALPPLLGRIPDMVRRD